MSAFDELQSAIQSSTKLDAPTRQLLLQFLLAGAPVFQSLEQNTLATLLTWLAGTSPTEPPPAVDQLNPAQVRALLDLTQSQMDGMLDERRKEVAAARAATAQLADAALALLTRLLIAAL